MPQTNKQLVELIEKNLFSNPAWVERAIIVLYEHQTSCEQNSQETCETNGMGFNKPDANRMSFVAKFLKSGGHLTRLKALKYYAPKLKKYAKQLAKIASAKS